MYHFQLSGKKGGTPRKKDMAFVSPDGEEISNKWQLDKYLKSHPGVAVASDFEWVVSGRRALIVSVTD